MKLTFLLPWGLVLLLFASGCSASRDAAWSPPSPLATDYPAYQSPVSPTSRGALPQSTPTPPQRLALADALELALLHNPTLQTFAWEIRVHEARTLQAGLLSNPEIVYELENFGGDGPFAGQDGSEVTLAFSQLIELGGDRHQRRRATVAQQDLARWDYEAVRLDVFTATRQAFIDVLASQQRLILADSLLVEAERFYQSVEARVDAGKVSALEEQRARIELTTTALRRANLVRDLTLNRTRLAAMWGATLPTFTQVEGNLRAIEAVPPYSELTSFIARNPDVARWRDEMVLRQAQLSVAQAQGIPNPTVSFGTRHLRELETSAFLASITLPLPLFDRNQGAIREAKYRLRQGEAAQQALFLQAQQMLAEAYGRLTTAYEEATAIQDNVLAAAQENYEATEEGYREGKFDLLTVLDARRTLFEVTNQYVHALAAYHLALADVERLIGTPLSDI